MSKLTNNIKDMKEALEKAYILKKIPQICSNCRIGVSFNKRAVLKGDTVRKRACGDGKVLYTFFLSTSYI